MKKLCACIFIVSILSSIFISCSQKKSSKNQEYLITGAEELNLPSKEELLLQAETSEKQNPSKKSDKIDVDLTKMSATMIYANVFDMLIDPDSYIDKRIKMKGNFQVFTNEEQTEQYYAVIIQDATACCQQGIEFIWDGNHTYPNDYPQIGQEVTVTGFYKVAYTPDDLMYNFLLADTVIF